MVMFKCKMCGGEMDVNSNDLVVVCPYCRTRQTIPMLGDDRRASLYDRANYFRRNNEFDKASGIYESILKDDETDAEAYWSIVLCRYGVEYVEDPVSHKRVPTVNRTQFTSILNDKDYKAALIYAGENQRDIYEKEAKAIDEIQKRILEISKKEDAFDVFICYKETDEKNDRTMDSVLAYDIYQSLSDKGYKVFFSRVTLEDKLGTEYEPYIFAALNSAKIMIVVGTKPEYFNAVWVKNEWSRYLSLIKSGQKKVLIPAYKDMSPYDMPEEFTNLQSQDMSKLGFMQDLVRGVEKILADTETKSADDYKSNEEVYKEEAYRKAIVALHEAKTKNDFKKLIKQFKSLDGYKNSDAQIKACEENIKRINAKSKKIRMRLMVSLSAIALVAVVIVIIIKFVIPSIDYNKAMKFIEQKEYVKAYELLEELDGFSDSEKQMDNIKLDMQKQAIKESVVGDTVTLGTYNQDEEKSTREDIEWIIVKTEGNKKLLISKYILEYELYKENCIEASWEESRIRKWLNGKFYVDGFDDDVHKWICTTNVISETNKYGIATGGDTEDKIFILSANEYRELIENKIELENETKYLSTDANTFCWWLRTVGNESNFVAYCDYRGKISDYGMLSHKGRYGIRPAMWVEVE